MQKSKDNYIEKKISELMKQKNKQKPLKKSYTAVVTSKDVVLTVFTHHYSLIQVH